MSDLDRILVDVQCRAAIHGALEGTAQAFELNENRTYTGLEVAEILREAAETYLKEDSQ
jgi:hypothetical protein